LEICRLIIKHQGGKALIVCPLGVKQEFTNDAIHLRDSIGYLQAADKEIDTPMLFDFIKGKYECYPET
jgi:hypothetical protein